MELLFLGTGPAVGIPREGHTDEACLDALRGGKSRRRRSAALIRAGKTTLLIDAGPDIEEQLEEAGVEKLDGVFLTHGHADASGGLTLLNGWVGRRGFATKLPVFTDRQTKQRLERRYQTLRCLQLIPVKGFDEVVVGDVTVVPLPVEHAMDKGTSTFGYRIGNRLGYVSDTCDIPARSAEKLEGLNTLVLDAAFFFGRKLLPSHLTTDESIAWGRKLGVKRLVMTQIGHSYPPHAVAERELRGFLKTNNIGKPHCELAYDGLRIKV